MCLEGLVLGLHKISILKHVINYESDDLKGGIQSFRCVFSQRLPVD